MSEEIISLSQIKRMATTNPAELLQIIKDLRAERGMLEAQVFGLKVAIDTFNGIADAAEEAERKLALLRRYHGGDGTVSRDDVMGALGK